MIVRAEVAINGTRARAWAVITDIEHSAETIGGITGIEIVERPTHGLVGLRWRETRLLFGSPATVEKRITDAVENESFRTRAESDGFVFECTRTIRESPGGLTLSESHETKPQGVVAHLKAIPMVLFFRGVIRRAIEQDLRDLKSAVERP